MALKGGHGRPREAPQTATAGAFGAREINKVYDVTVWGQLPALGGRPDLPSAKGTSLMSSGSSAALSYQRTTPVGSEKVATPYLKGWRSTMAALFFA